MSPSSLLPPYPPTGVLGYYPSYQHVGAIIDDVLYSIVELQIQMEVVEDPDVEIQIKYYRGLMEYWSNVYLELYGERYEILIC